MQRSLFIVLLTLATTLPGQTIVEHSLPAPISLYNSSPIFHGNDAVAFASNGEFHWITGLPDAPVAHSIPLSGALEPAGSWTSLSATEASYASVSGELILVRGLPHAPFLTATGLPFPTTPLIVVNNTTAVAVDTANQQFHVLRHTPASTTLTAISSYAPLSDGAYTWAPIDEDRLMGLGAGQSDGVSGTFDDEIVVLGGLSGPVGSTGVSTAPIPVGSLPRGFVVSESGVGALWEDLDWLPSPTVAVTLVRDSALGLELTTLTVPAYVLLALPPPALGIPFGGVVRGRGDTLLLQVVDYPLVGFGYTLIKDLTTNPVIAGTISTQSQPEDILLAENEFVLSHYGGPLLSLTSFAGTAPQYAPLTVPGDPTAITRPNRSSLLAFSTSYGVSGPEMSYATLVHDPFGAGIAQIQELASCVVKPTVLGPGRVAWFTQNSTSGSVVSGIAVMTLPINTIVGPPDPYARWLSAWPTLPSIEDDLTIQALTYPTSDDVFVFVSDALLPEPVVPSAFPGSFPLVIDPNHAFPPILLPSNGSLFNEITIPLSDLPPSLRGIPLYLQAVRTQYSALDLSQTLMLSIG